MDSNEIRYTERERIVSARLANAVDEARSRANKHAKDLKRLKDKARIRTIRENAKEGASGR